MSQIMTLVNAPTSAHKNIFIKAMERFTITERELNDAFWLAYADAYVPATGIEFRHLWKHIEVMRKGSTKRTYTYEEMLNYCDKNGIGTDSFSIYKEEKDSKGRPKWVLK